MSNWGKKLVTKLNALNESSSKESMQTLAKWICFNRKHAATAFVPVLKESLLQAKTAALQLTRLSVLHEVLILDKDDSTKWERTEALRVTIGEGVLLPVAAQLQEPARDKLRSTFLKEWDDSNSLAGPSLINQIRTAVSNKSASESAPPAAPTNANSAVLSESPTSKSPEVQESPKEPTPQDTMETGKDDKDKVIEKSTEAPATTQEPILKVKQPPKSTSAKTSYSAAATTTTTSTYDFEASDIPAAAVDPKNLLEPTRTIASLQIARDLRNDGAVQLSSLLSNLPENIKQSCKDQEELTVDKARDYAMRTPDVLIDMDLEEQLQSIRMYRDIVKRQRASRKQLIHALIQSRCQFGAQEAAEGFENAHRARDQLLKRKQVLMDAMELEGLDVTEEEKNLYAKDATEFEPLEWHKKARTEE